MTSPSCAENYWYFVIILPMRCNIEKQIQARCLTKVKTLTTCTTLSFALHFLCISSTLRDTLTEIFSLEEWESFNACKHMSAVLRLMMNLKLIRNLHLLRKNHFNRSISCQCLLLPIYTPLILLIWNCCEHFARTVEKRNLKPKLFFKNCR